ncbi:hypothetical protein V6N11_001162 [Hibiscus sabdariffa]|uniref:FFD box profile domain-containing protein n=1 Tax=Hibiscus sabdariffa TaxID=183260 RepID=A0ABR2RYX0_9ROSI
MELRCRLIIVIEDMKEDEEEEEEEMSEGGIKALLTLESYCLSNCLRALFYWSLLCQPWCTYKSHGLYSPMAMEKFNKDEVWGHLGKSSRAQEDADDLQNEDSVESSEVDVKPVYVKDDFFDSLSYDSLGGG